MNMRKKLLVSTILILCAAAVMCICYRTGFPVSLFNAETKITTTDVSDKIQNTDKEIIARSGLLPMRDINDVILNSELIIIGTVDEILESKWTAPEISSGILQTDIVIDVDEILFGEPSSGDQITLRIDKGEDEYTISLDEWTPDFTVGEQSLLFLMRDDSDFKTDEDYYVLSANEQAKYVLQGDGTAVCEFENKTVDLDELPGLIEDLYEQNPNIREEQAAERQRIKEENAELFGE